MRKAWWTIQYFWWQLRVWSFHLWFGVRRFVAEKLCYEFLGEAYLHGWYAGTSAACQDYDDGYRDGQLDAAAEFGYATREKTPLTTPESEPRTTPYDQLYNES